MLSNVLLKSIDGETTKYTWKYQNAAARSGRFPSFETALQVNSWTILATQALGEKSSKS